MVEKANAVASQMEIRAGQVVMKKQTNRAVKTNPNRSLERTIETESSIAPSKIRSRQHLMNFAHLEGGKHD